MTTRIKDLSQAWVEVKERCPDCRDRPLKPGEIPKSTCRTCLNHKRVIHRVGLDELARLFEAMVFADRRRSMTDEIVVLYTGPPLKVSRNPPLSGLRALRQRDVTAEMTKWASAILNGPADYPMHAEVSRYFGGAVITARVEWHTLQGATGKTGLFRGVSLYETVEA